MAFERIAEDRIKQAIAEGKFDRLSRAGEPLNLEEYFSTPEDLRMAYSILKNANCAPVEVELLKEIARLRDAVIDADDAAVKQSLQQTLSRRETELAILIERSASRRHAAS
jgi:DnaJ homologue, subfamily C, member 28, conserved domain